MGLHGLRLCAAVIVGKTRVSAAALLGLMIPKILWWEVEANAATAASLPYC